eukprot:2201015-Pyramimonas_sp.AAC.2
MICPTLVLVLVISLLFVVLLILLITPFNAPTCLPTSSRVGGGRARMHDDRNDGKYGNEGGGAEEEDTDIVIKQTSVVDRPLPHRTARKHDIVV